MTIGAKTQAFQEQDRHSGTAPGPGPEAIDAGSKTGPNMGRLCAAKKVGLENGMPTEPPPACGAMRRRFFSFS
jgi:hypothetical protein